KVGVRVGGHAQAGLPDMLADSGPRQAGHATVRSDNRLSSYGVTIHEKSQPFPEPRLTPRAATCSKSPTPCTATMPVKSTLVVLTSPSAQAAFSTTSTLWTAELSLRKPNTSTFTPGPARSIVTLLVTQCPSR